MERECKDCGEQGHKFVCDVCRKRRLEKVQEQARKVVLPEYCCPQTLKFSGGDKNCNHDYPPESKIEHDEWVEWTCSKCSGTLTVEVYQ